MNRFRTGIPKRFVPSIGAVVARIRPASAMGLRRILEWRPCSRASLSRRLILRALAACANLHQRESKDGARDRHVDERQEEDSHERQRLQEGHTVNTKRHDASGPCQLPVSRFAKVGGPELEGLLRQNLLVF